MTGAIEMVSAIALLIPSLAFYGAVALAATMIGAIFTHLVIVVGGPAMAVTLLEGHHQECAVTGLCERLERSDACRKGLPSDL